MTAALLFHWDAREGENAKLAALWGELGRAFGLELYAYTDGGLPRECPSGIECLFEDFARARLGWPGWCWVLLTAGGDQSLATFRHPERDVVYVTGPDYSTLDDGWADVRLRIGPGEVLHAFTAAAIVAHDRWTKMDRRLRPPEKAAMIGAAV